MKPYKALQYFYRSNSHSHWHIGENSENEIKMNFALRKKISYKIVYRGKSQGNEKSEPMVMVL